MFNHYSYSASSSPMPAEMLPGPSERDRLDNLIGQALLDPGIRDRLLVQHDPALLDSFDLSEDTRRWLAGLHVGSLKEFAQAIVSAPRPYRLSESF